MTLVIMKILTSCKKRNERKDLSWSYNFPEFLPNFISIDSFIILIHSKQNWFLQCHYLTFYWSSSQHIAAYCCTNPTRLQSDVFSDRNASDKHSNTEPLGSIRRHNKHISGCSTWRRKFCLCGHQQVWIRLENVLCNFFG